MERGIILYLVDMEGEMGEFVEDFLQHSNTIKSSSRYLYELAKACRDKRWKMKEKRRGVREKEEGVMVWLLETKMRRREEKLKRQRDEAWKR